MTNTNQLILDLISKNASVNEITSITGLSAKQLFHRMNMLKIKGYDFKRKYYYNGDICYDLVKKLNKEKTNETTILTSKKDTEFKALLISDLHLGNISERPDLLYEVYNFCVKEGIHIIINTGDLIDGSFGFGGDNNKKISDIEKQIDYLLKVYPYDKNILNFICLGNHDYSSLTEKGLDLNKILDNKRHDLISLGYGKGVINIKNDKILLNHYTDGIAKIDRIKDYHLRFDGHYHHYKNTVKDTYVSFDLPSLSEMPIGNYKQFPSMMLATLSFELGLFKIGKFEQFIYVNNDIFKVSEIECDLIKGKNREIHHISNEEERKGISEKDIDNILNKNLQPVIKKNIVKEEKVKEKTLELSPVEKFNKKWNRK